MEYVKTLEAILTIREVCRQHEECAFCPLFGDTSCKLIEEIPFNWRLKIPTLNSNCIFKKGDER